MVDTFQFLVAADRQIALGVRPRKIASTTLPPIAYSRAIIVIVGGRR
jgi:hypothetical protein